MVYETNKRETKSWVAYLILLFLFVFKENGLLSYENPNYHLDPARLDDALNSNTELYEELYQELDDICNMVHGVKAPLSGGSGRKAYAALDIGSMGVNVSTGPITQLDSTNATDNRRLVHLIEIQFDHLISLLLLREIENNGNAMNPNQVKLSLCNRDM